MSIAPIAVSIGEPAGIGPDIILSAWLKRESASLPGFVVVGDVGLLKVRAIELGLNIEIEPVSLDKLITTDPNSLPVLQLSDGMKASAACPHPDDAKWVIEAIKIGVDLVRNQHAAGLVTCPINKKALYDAEIGRASCRERV